MYDKKPFLLTPAGKDYIWGGSRLRTEYNKDLGLEPLAETWECSTHPDGPSVAANGVHKGMSLRRILKEHPEYMGTSARARGGCGARDGELPVLIKFIDAKKDLSVQVHPDDGYARLHENGQLGKTEMWYVLDASSDASLVLGFERDMTKEELRKSLADGTLEKYLRRVPVRRGDVFYIEAGTVHAIGAGALIAEIQENSNLTYRLYDYNRTDGEGRKRPLQIDRALEAASLARGARTEPVRRPVRYGNGLASELLCSCPYFQVERCLADPEAAGEEAVLGTLRDSFRALLCLDGSGRLYTDENDFFQFFKGDCIFIPADSAPVKIRGKAEFLNVRC